MATLTLPTGVRFPSAARQQKPKAGPDFSTAGQTFIARNSKSFQRKPEILHPPLFGETKASKELKGGLCSLALLQRRLSNHSLPRVGKLRTTKAEVLDTKGINTSHNPGLSHPQHHNRDVPSIMRG